MTIAHRPIVWKSGNIEYPTSSAVSDSRERYGCEIQQMLRFVWTTPFDAPVVPDV